MWHMFLVRVVAELFLRPTAVLRFPAVDTSPAPLQTARGSFPLLTCDIQCTAGGYQSLYMY